MTKKVFLCMAVTLLNVSQAFGAGKDKPLDHDTPSAFKSNTPFVDAIRGKYFDLDGFLNKVQEACEHSSLKSKFGECDDFDLEQIIRKNLENITKIEVDDSRLKRVTNKVRGWKDSVMGTLGGWTHAVKEKISDFKKKNNQDTEDF